MHAILGTSVSWKAFKLAVPLYSTDTEARVCLLAVKRTKQHILFMKHLGLQCSAPTSMHEENTDVTALVKSNKITNRICHMDILLC